MKYTVQRAREETRELVAQHRAWNASRARGGARHLAGPDQSTGPSDFADHGQVSVDETG